jgi:hypothetical protein
MHSCIVHWTTRDALSPFATRFISLILEQMDRRIEVCNSRLESDSIRWEVGESHRVSLPHLLRIAVGLDACVDGVDVLKGIFLRV